MKPPLSMVALTVKVAARAEDAAPPSRAIAATTIATRKVLLRFRIDILHYFFVYYDQERTFTAPSKYKDTSEAEFLSPWANAMLEKSQTPKIEAQFNATLEKYGAFLRQTIALICPKTWIQLDTY
jgi:hypothetical protein